MVEVIALHASSLALIFLIWLARNAGRIYMRSLG